LGSRIFVNWVLPICLGRSEVCSAETSAEIMRYSFPKNIRDEVHTKWTALGSDNRAAPYAFACAGAATDSQQLAQEFQGPSWRGDFLYYSEPPRSAKSSADAAHSAESCASYRPD
jgi:hypothetical protein